MSEMRLKRSAPESKSGDSPLKAETLTPLGWALSQVPQPEKEEVTHTRWVVDNHPGLFAALGNDFVKRVDDLDKAVDELGPAFGLAQRAIANTEGSWTDADTFVRTCSRYAELKAELGNHAVAGVVDDAPADPETLA
jgi:hypothetical protein